MCVFEGGQYSGTTWEEEVVEEVEISSWKFFGGFLFLPVWKQALAWFFAIQMQSFLMLVCKVEETKETDKNESETFSCLRFVNLKWILTKADLKHF